MSLRIRPKTGPRRPVTSFDDSDAVVRKHQASLLLLIVPEDSPNTLLKFCLLAYHLKANLWRRSWDLKTAFSRAHNITSQICQAYNRSSVESLPAWG